MSTLANGLWIIFADALGVLAMVSPALFICGLHRTR